MLDSPRRGQRGPAPSWKLGRTCAIRVPIILADALLNFARRIDDGEVTLADAFTTQSDKQVPEVLVAQNEDEKDIQEEQTQKKRALGITRAEASARYGRDQLNFVKAQALFVKVQKNLFRNNTKPKK